MSGVSVVTISAVLCLTSSLAVETFLSVSGQQHVHLALVGHDLHSRQDHPGGQGEELHGKIVHGAYMV